MIKGIPEPPPVERDEELEAIIRRLAYRRDDTREGSAEYRMIIRQMRGLRSSSKLAEEILEDYDFWG